MVCGSLCTAMLIHSWCLGTCHSEVVHVVVYWKCCEVVLLHFIMQCFLINSITIEGLLRVEILEPTEEVDNFSVVCVLTVYKDID